MPLNWYPGHMHKAKKELGRIIDNIDVLVEVLDARIPLASSNPALLALRGDRPCIRILNKADLATPAITQDWQGYFSHSAGSGCLISASDNRPDSDSLLQLARKLLAAEGSPRKRQMLIWGIPNCGKSTLLNHFAGRKLAATGNEPAVTKRQQRVRLAEGWDLVDTPGLLWPKLSDQDGAYKLAMVGSIRNTAFDMDDVGYYAAEFLLQHWRPALAGRYQLPETISKPEQVLEAIAASRGARSRGGATDWYKAAELLLNDFRSGKLGRLSLEWPEGCDQSELTR